MSANKRNKLLVNLTVRGIVLVRLTSCLFLLLACILRNHVYGILKDKQCQI